MVSVKVVGALSATLCLPEGIDTVGGLRHHVAKALGIPSSAASSLTLIVSGKTLRDDSVTINGDDDGSGGSSSSVKISESTRVLVLRGGSAPPASAPPAAAALEARLEALKAAAEKLVAGNGSRGSGGELVIETQDGGGSDALAGLPEADARAIKLGLTLAAKGSASLDEARKVMRERNRGEEGNGSGPPSTSSVSAAAAAHVSARRQRMRQRATEALAELDIASQALSLIAASSAPSSASSPHSAAQQLLRRADNVALLHLDWAWAAYLAGEPARLAAAAQKLKEARRALEAAAAASRGRDRSRARAEIGDGGGSTSSSRGGGGGGGPEGALRVRLDLLEGIAAAASGRGASGEAAALLSRAAQGWLSWQAPSAASVDALVEMGFLRSEARRALRFVGGTGGRRGNLDAAAAAAADMRRASGAADSASTNKRSAAAAAGGGGSSRVEHRAQKAARRAEATTEGGKPIDAGVVSQLMALGFDPNLAAAAAATNDNNLDAALDALSDVESNLTLQTSVEERKKRRKEEMKEGGGEDDNGGEEERGGGGGSGGDGDDDDENEDNETAPAPEAEGAERALLESLEAQRPSDPLAASLEVELDLEGSALVTWLRRLGRGEEAEELVRAGAKEEED